MKEYRFLEASWILMIAVFIITVILNSYLAFKLQEAFEVLQGSSAGLAIVIYIILVPVLTSRLLAFSNTTILLNESEIHVCRSSIIGLPIKSDFKLHYSQIKEYVFQEDINWYWIKLVDKNGRKYRIWRFALFDNAEYKKCRDSLHNEIRRYNEEIKNSAFTKTSPDLIKESPNIYQGNWGLVIGAISLITLIVTPLVLILFEFNFSSIIPLIVGLSGACYMLIKVRNERTKK